MNDTQTYTLEVELKSDPLTKQVIEDVTNWGTSADYLWIEKSGEILVYPTMNIICFESTKNVKAEQ